MNQIQIQYRTLSPIYKRILREIYRLHRKYKGCVFTLISSLARIAVCCIRTVKRAIKYFIKIGWLGKMDRKRQSSLYFLAEDIKQKLFEMRTPNTQVFTSENVTQKSPIVSKCKEKKFVIDSKHPKESKNNTKFKQRGPKEITQEDIKQLKQEFSEYVYEEARQRYNWSCKVKGFRPDNLYAYVRHLCKKIFQGK